MKIRLGVFIFAVVLVCFSFVFSKEQQTLEQLIKKSNFFEIAEETESGICFETNLSPEQIVSILNAKIHSKQTIQGQNMEIFYCFVENINNYVLIDNKKVNLQIVFLNGKSKLGFPLILTGY